MAEKRTFLNGVVTLVASGTRKCVDYRVPSKHCASCKSWKTKKNMQPDVYEEFVATHNCSINHTVTGSSGAMEAAGLVDCFKSYIQNRGLRYTNFIDDGDSKSYLEIVANDPYSGVTVQNLECVGQKRARARLRKLKSENKGKLSDGKPLTGKGRLTEKVINKLQNYFGIAIRQSTGTTVFELKKAIGAVLYHCTDFTEDETRHQFVRLSLTHGVNTKLIK